MKYMTKEALRASMATATKHFKGYSKDGYKLIEDANTGVAKVTRDKVKKFLTPEQLEIEAKARALGREAAAIAKRT